MFVLKDLDPHALEIQSHYHLSTKMVETWRVKPSPTGSGDAYLRRARLVAREFRWLSADLDDEVFSPASSSVLLKVLPALLMAKQSTGDEWTALSLDVVDAYLTVEQRVDTVISVVVHGETRFFKLLRNLPGQRCGAKDWFESFQTHLVESLAIEPLVESPVLFRIPPGDKAIVRVAGQAMAGLAKAEVARMEMTAEDCSMLMICLLWDARRAFVD